jgi:UDP-N-acetylmuramoylalanine--D-glutamate ligase
MPNKSKIALFGYGKTTKAIANYLGNECIFFDDNATKSYKDELNNTINPTSHYNANDFEVAIPSPGIFPTSKLITTSQNIISEYDFFLSNKSKTVDKIPFNIWISGTNGKTTTTQMLTHLLKDKGALSGGNIGIPLANLDTKAPIWVLETSSFTLHYTNSAKPNIYLLLPITPDHLDWHGGKDGYIADKLKPLKLMQEGELALVPKGLPLPKSDAWIVEYSDISDLEEFFKLDASKVKFKGAFGLDAMLALSVVKALFGSVDYSLINNFTIDAHRQEELKDSSGRVWVNDSKATNTDAALEAIKLYKDKKIHLILGGDDKGVDLREFFSNLEEFNLHIYAIGSNANKLELLSKEHNIPCSKVDILQKALIEIDKKHTLESIALLAPAASSLDQFPSYAKRGEQFKEFVANLSFT